MSTNGRYANGARRRALRARLLAYGRANGIPCAICHKPIDYSLTTYVDPVDGKRKRHPMSFEVDEKVPFAKGGSPYDWDNVQPAHRICNQRKGAGNKPASKAQRVSRPW